MDVYRIYVIFCTRHPVTGYRLHDIMCTVGIPSIVINFTSQRDSNVNVRITFISPCKILCTKVSCLNLLNPVNDATPVILYALLE